MKRIIFFSLLIVLFSACGKEKSLENGNNSGVFLKFKLDGQSIEYKDFVFASKDIINDQHIVTIQGQKDVSSLFPGLGIFLQDSVEITNKTYGDDGSIATNALVYSDTAGVNYASLYMTDASELNVVITRIDTAFISGTFSSKVADINANTKNITEGSFQARFQ